MVKNKQLKVMITDLEEQLNYVIAHCPIRYTVKRKNILYWTIESVDGRLYGKAYKVSHVSSFRPCSFQEYIHHKIGYL